MNRDRFQRAFTAVYGALQAMGVVDAEDIARAIGLDPAEVPGQPAVEAPV